MDTKVLRGNFPARIDAKGRLKIPTAFRIRIQSDHGAELFVTSLTGEYVRVYPMPVWLALESKMARMPSAHPSKMRFLERVNFFGQPAEMDRQGRVLIHGHLRESAGCIGDVAVLGKVNHLDVWNDDRFRTKLKHDQFTETDALALAEYGI